MHVPGVGFTKSCALSGLAELARFGFGDFLGVFGATQMVEFERFISCFLAFSSVFLLGFPEKEPISLFGGKVRVFVVKKTGFVELFRRLFSLEFMIWFRYVCLVFVGC